MRKDNEVVVSGMGCVTSIGTNLEEFEKAYFQGQSGVRSIRGKLVNENFPVPYAAFISADELNIPDFLQSKKLSVSQKMTAMATEELIQSSQLKDLNVDAIVYGTADGFSFEVISDLFRSYPDAPVEAIGSERPLRTLAEVLSHHKIECEENQIICINGACSSGNQSIGLAMQRIRSGEWQRAIVGGVDARCSPTNMMNFHMIDALCVEDIEPTKASRPFSSDRNGFIRGEGAASLLLESRASAQKRGAQILAVIKGYANTTDAHRLTDGREDVKCVRKAIEWTIEDAEIKKEDVQVISAHGTSTKLNDRLETKAIKEVFGKQAYKMPITSLKSQIGHTTVAAGAIEAVSCVLMLQKQKVAATINFNEPDPYCDLNYTPNQPRDFEIKHILSNNFAFGGQNACLIIMKEHGHD